MKHIALAGLIIATPAPTAPEPEVPCTIPREIDVVCHVGRMATERGHIMSCITRSGVIFEVLVPRVAGGVPS